MRPAVMSSNQAENVSLLNISHTMSMAALDAIATLGDLLDGHPELLDPSVEDVLARRRHQHGLGREVVEHRARATRRPGGRSRWSRCGRSRARPGTRRWRRAAWRWSRRCAPPACGAPAGCAARPVGRAGLVAVVVVAAPAAHLPIGHPAVVRLHIQTVNPACLWHGPRQAAPRTSRQVIARVTVRVTASGPRPRTAASGCPTRSSPPSPATSRSAPPSPSPPSHPAFRLASPPPRPIHPVRRVMEQWQRRLVRD